MPTKAHADPSLSANSQAAILNQRGMKLTDLLAGISTAQPLSVINGAAEREVSGIAYNSRKVIPESAFFAIRGETTDGNLFIQDAIARGAMAIISELPRPNGAALPSEWQQLLSRAGKPVETPSIPKNVAWIQVKEARKSLSIA